MSSNRLDIALDAPARMLVIAFADPAAITGPVALKALRAVADVGWQDDRCSVATLGEVIVLHRAVSPKDKARWKALARGR